MAGWPAPQGARRLEETDRASGFLAGRFQRYVPYGLAFTWPEDNASWSGRPLFPLAAGEGRVTPAPRP